MIIIPNKKHWIQEQSELNGMHRAILSGDRSITYSELYEHSLIVADFLKSQGIGFGDQIAVLNNHSSEFIDTVLALWFLGAIPVPLNTRNSISEIEEQLSFVNAKFLIADKLTLQKNSNLKFNNILISEDVFGTANSKEIVEHPEFYSQNSALILFTSGSTGKPKAVVHTFESLYQSVLLTDSFSLLAAKDVWLASLPFYHIGGFMIIVRTLLTGSTLALPTSTGHKNIGNALNKYKPTHISLVSTTLKQLLDDSIKPNPNLKYVYLGGGPIDYNLYSLAIQTGFPIVKVYGSTETCAMVAALSYNSFDSKPDSVGKPIGAAEIQITNRTGMFLNAGQSGEIVVKTRSLMKEYYSDYNETNKKVNNGFYFTGDYGWLDKDGYLYIESRREDLIISGGENVNPKEVEQFLIQLPSISDAYVFAEADETWGQVICAAVVINSIISQDEIGNQLKNMMAAYKVPKKFYFIERIPRNEMGKVEKGKLKKLLNQVVR
jgi:O-succinylbenzoic acid--CoA ligase